MSVLNVIAEVLAGALLVWLTVISAYIGLMTIGAWLKRPIRSAPMRRFKVAVVMPAHNEEAGIANTLADLFAMQYPREDFEVFVVADNCEDSTAEVAERCGAVVRQRQDDVNRGKGQALDWFLAGFGDELEQYDLIAFVDADMQVDPDFLHEAAQRFTDEQCDVVQARYTVDPNVSSWREAIGFASFAFVNHVRPAGRCFFGGTADLKGSGMLFRRADIVASGWPTHSIAEDVEFGKELLMGGTLVRYEPRAVVTTRIPDTFEQIAVQQSRWEGGKAVVMRRYFMPMLASFLRRPRWSLLDAMLDMIVPPLSVVIVAAGIGALAAALLTSLPWQWYLLPVLVFGVSVLTGLVQLRAPAGVWRRLVMTPAFVVWKLALLVRVKLGRTETSWQRTPRALK